MSRNYPEEIEITAVQLAGETEGLKAARENLALVEAQILFQILSEVDEKGKPVFSNEDKRGAELVIRLSQDERVCAIKQTISKTGLHQKQLEARLEKLRGLFSIEKIERREKLAALEAVQ